MNCQQLRYCTWDVCIFSFCPIRFTQSEWQQQQAMLNKITIIKTDVDKFMQSYRGTEEHAAGIIVLFVSLIVAYSCSPRHQTSKPKNKACDFNTLPIYNQSQMKMTTYLRGSRRIGSLKGSVWTCLMFNTCVRLEALFGRDGYFGICLFYTFPFIWGQQLRVTKAWLVL